MDKGEAIKSRVYGGESELHIDFYRSLHAKQEYVIHFPLKPRVIFLC